MPYASLSPPLPTKTVHTSQLSTPVEKSDRSALAISIHGYLRHAANHASRQVDFRVEHSFLRSKLPEVVGGVTLCTQGSLDRLKRFATQPMSFGFESFHFTTFSCALKFLAIAPRAASILPQVVLTGLCPTRAGSRSRLRSGTGRSLQLCT